MTIMKTIRTRKLISILGAFVCWLLPSSSWASVEIDGIYYELNNSAKTASVAPNLNLYSGQMTIPESISYDGDSFSVTSIGESAFSSSGLTSVTIPNSVTSIGDYAFEGSNDLTSVDIPNSVITIGGSAFDRCRRLTSVTIGNSVTSIGTWAFSYCVSLISVTIPNSVTSIGNHAFFCCESLTSITIPNSVASIGDQAFYGCTGLTSVTIPNSVTSIGDLTFSYCTGLTSINVDTGNTIYDSRNNCNAIIKTATNTLIKGCDNTVIPNNVTKIGEWAFSDCIGLSSVAIPNSVIAIKEGAFKYCIGLTSMTIPNGVKDIGRSAFSDCTGLTSITIPNSIIKIEELAFYGCTSLTSITCESETPVEISDVFRYVDKSACTLYVPAGSKSAYESAEGWNDFEHIVEIGSGQDILATGQCGDNVTYTIYSDMSVVISGTGEMWDYDNSSFNNDYNRTIEKLIIEDGVTHIGNFSFAGCTSLTSITLPNSVTSIGERSFFYCTGLTSVTIPNNVTYLGTYAFCQCSSLASVTIGSGLISIDYGQPFSSCTSLSSIIVDSRNTKYDSRDNCNAIIETATNELIVGCNNTVIPSSVTTIGDNAFYYSTGLSSIQIPNSVTRVKRGAFFGCTGLSSITIPYSVTSIDRQSFSGCTGLSQISVSGSNTKYDSRDNCNAIIETSTNELIAGCKNTIIPNSVTSIGSDAFFDCLSLTSITIPNSVTSIGFSAFFDCKGLTTITIPSSVSFIGGSAFYFCIGLTSIKISSSVTTIGDYAFAYCTGLTSITCESETPVAITNSVFDNVPKSTCTLYVPAGSKTLYESAEGWNEFEHIVEIGSGQDILATGQCGDDVTYTIYSDMSMVISGTGEMWGYTNNGNFGLHINDDYYQSIEKVIIEDGVTNIGGSAFRGCTSLTSIDIPNSVTSFGVFAFEDCTSLASIEIPNSVTDLSITHTFCGCSSLTSITIPNGVGYIGIGTFNSCTGLTSIEIPNSVTSIWEGAFKFCTSLTSIEIPNSVTSIDRYAFYGCSGLTSITCEGETPASIENSSSFEGVDKSNCILYVPLGSKTTYESAEYWNEFEHIVEFGGEPDTDISALDNVIYVEQVDGRIGDTMDIPVKLKNDFDVRGFQFTMELPEGTTVNSWKMSTNRLPSGATESDKVSMQKIEGNKIVVACTLNYGDATFTGNDGVIATVNVTFADDMEEGSYPIYLTACASNDATGYYNPQLSDVKSTLVLENYVSGDANGDGRVMIGDVTAILNYIVGNQFDNFKMKAADVNGDGKVLIGDVTAVLNLIVNQ